MNKQLLIHAVELNLDELVPLNNRGLAALSLADLKPTNISIVQPTVKELQRLTEAVMPPVRSCQGQRLL